MWCHPAIRRVSKFIKQYSTSNNLLKCLTYDSSKQPGRWQISRLVHPIKPPKSSKPAQFLYLSNYSAIQKSMSANKLYGRWETLQVTVHKCVTTSSNAGLCLLCSVSSMIRERSRWCGMLRGHYPTFVVEKVPSRTGISSNPLCQCLQSWFIRWMMRCWLMHVGQSHISRMARTRKFKLSSSQESLEDLSNCSCILITRYYLSTP